MKNVLRVTKLYDWQELSKSIAWYRRSFNLTQLEFAKLINVDNSKVSRWESGQTQPKAEDVVNAARLFGISEQDLLHPSGEVKKWMNRSLEEA